MTVVESQIQTSLTAVCLVSLKSTHSFVLSIPDLAKGFYDKNVWFLAIQKAVCSTWANKVMLAKEIQVADFALSVVFQ